VIEERGCLLVLIDFGPLFLLSICALCALIAFYSCLCILSNKGMGFRFEIATFVGKHPTKSLKKTVRGLTIQRCHWTNSNDSLKIDYFLVIPLGSFQPAWILYSTKQTFQLIGAANKSVSQTYQNCRANGTATHHNRRANRSCQLIGTLSHHVPAHPLTGWSTFRRRR
jgi:hypothetical protein